MATIDDFLREQQNTNDLLRELLNNYSGAGSGGGPGVGPSRRRGSGRHSGGPDPYRDIRYRQDENPKNLEELIEQYERIEELEIGRFKRMKEQKKAAKEFLDTYTLLPQSHSQSHITESFPGVLLFVGSMALSLPNF